MTDDASAARGPTTTRGIDRIELEHKQRLLIARKPKALALADGEIGDAVMAAQHRAALVHDIAGARGVGADAAHDLGIAARGHKADVLAVGLVAR